MRRARFFPGKLIYDHKKGSCGTGQTTSKILKQESKRDLDGMGIVRVLEVTPCLGQGETRQVLILAAARDRWALQPKMCALGELIQQPSSGTRCLHAPLRTQMTFDEDVPS